jgi:amino acid transporter
LTFGCLVRMLWAFARDGGVPFSRVWSAVHGCTGTPVNAVWAMSALAFLLGLPMLYSLDVFQALASISSVGLYTSCEAPVFYFSHLAVSEMYSENMLKSGGLFKLVCPLW